MGMLLGIAVYRIGGVTTQKKTLRIRHLLLMGSGVICALIGIVAIVSNKIIHEKSVVSTLHFVTHSVIEHPPPLCLLCPPPLCLLCPLPLCLLCPPPLCLL